MFLLKCLYKISSSSLHASSLSLGLLLLLLLLLSGFELLRVEGLDEATLVRRQASKLIVKYFLSQRLIALQETERGVLAHFDFFATQVPLQLLQVHCLADVDQRLPTKLLQHLALVL